MSVLNQSQNNRKVFMLAVVSIFAAMFFSFLGAPFLRAFAVTAKSKIFWAVGTLFVVGLFILGRHDNQLLQAAIYIGAIWMTSGTYNELEKRGVGWRKSGAIAMLSGIVFAGAGYIYLSLTPTNSELLNQLIEPLQVAINKAFPANPIELNVLISFLPGLFIASLFSALAFSFLLEARIVRLFGFQKFKVASSLKWLEFRLPDIFIWTALFSLFFSVINFENKLIQTISINVLIVSSVAFLVQGLIVMEFMMRLLGFGSISKAITYLLVFIQLAPFVVFIGLVDYWADFRKFVRRKSKNKG